MISRKIIIAVTGASGGIYAERLWLLLKNEGVSKQISQIGVVFSSAGIIVREHEIACRGFDNFPFPVYDNSTFDAPFASGSAGYDTMIVIPCSMGTLGRIASGASQDLISRAADVILKERQKLILVVRETPLNLIHIKNMKKITEAGGIIYPASPSFYLGNTSLEETIDLFLKRLLQFAGFEIETKRWQE